MTVPESVINRLARKKIAIQLIGEPVRADIARYLPSLRTKDRGDETHVYVIDTKERVTHYNPEMAREFVRTLSDKHQKEGNTNTARGVSGRVELQSRLQEITGQSYEKSLKEAKKTVRDYPDELLSMMW